MRHIRQLVIPLVFVTVLFCFSFSPAEEAPEIKITVPVPSDATGSRPSSAGSRLFEIDPVIVMDRGYASFSWQDSADKGPYRVIYINNSDPLFRVYALGSEQESTIDGKAALCKSLVPGNSYTISVTDRDGVKRQQDSPCPKRSLFVQAACEPRNGPGPQVSEPFRSGSLTAGMITAVHRCRSRDITSGAVRDLSFLNASQITGKAGSTEYGLFYQIQFQPLDNPPDCHVQIALVSPVGYLFVIHDDHMTMPSFKKGTGKYTYEFLGPEMFRTLTNRFGSVPSGDYDIVLYIDGMFVRSDRFTVKE